MNRPPPELCDPSMYIAGPDGPVVFFSWDLSLVALSVAVAIGGSFLALEMAQRLIRAEGREQRRFLFVAGAGLMGLAVWTMHFVGMLALRMPVPVTYDVGWNVASLIAAAMGAGIAFSVIRRQKSGRFHLLTGGTAMGIAIVSMHYLGMVSLHMGATIDYEPVRFAGSVALAIAASTGALSLAFFSPKDRRHILPLRASSAVVMGLAIAGMHYLGMLAARYTATSVDAVGGGEPMVGSVSLQTVVMVAAAIFASALIALALRAGVEKDRALDELRQLTIELERRVQARTAELRVANRDLSTFAHSVSHDLRAPLRAIAGFSGVLRECALAKLSEEERGYLQRIDRSAARLDQMLSGLMKLADASQAPVVRTAVDLSRLAQVIAGELAAAEPDRAVRITVAPGLIAHGDEQLLNSVLQNLLANAWKFTRGRPDAHIEFGRADRSEGDAFFVRDNGIGFAAEQADRIFNLFERAGSQVEGSGIGLAVAKRVIERHGGRIWAESEPDRGATFLFTLPDDMSVGPAPGSTG